MPMPLAARPMDPMMGLLLAPLLPYIPTYRTDLEMIGELRNVQVAERLVAVLGVF